MTNQETNTKPQDVEQPADEGLDVTACSACFGVLKRDEYPEYFNGFTEEGGACWTSSKTETLRVDSKDIARIIAKIVASPWLRTMKGIIWEYLPNI